MSTEHLAVWVDDTFACVKITGRAGCPSSVSFRTLLLGLRDRGWHRFVLDLTDCQLMDSTFLGVLAGLALRFSEAPASGPRTTMELLNPSPRITGLLDNLGIAEHFHVHNGHPVATGQLTPLPQQPETASHEELRRASLEAHQLLIRLNPENAAKFKDVCKFLEDDLHKLEQKKDEPSQEVPN